MRCIFTSLLIVITIISSSFFHSPYKSTHSF